MIPEQGPHGQAPVLQENTWELHAHPAGAQQPGTALRVTLYRRAGQPRVCLHYALSGELAQLRIPPPDPAPAFTDNLWQHSCMELFVAQTSSPQYLEFNFSPSGHWAAYAFDAPRRRSARPPTIARPRIRAQASATELHLRVALELPPPWRGHTLDLGLSAVLKTRAGALSHWAPQHALPRPDFHDRRTWLQAAWRAP